MKSDQPKIFLGFVEVAGYYAGLVSGFKQLGIPCVFVEQRKHPFGYDSQSKGFIFRWFQSLGTLRGRTGQVAFPSRILVRLLFELVKLPIFIWAIIRFDVFIFGFGSSFYSLAELPLLRKLGKRIIFVLHGTDARPAYLDGTIMGEGKPYSIDECVRLAEDQKRRILKIEEYADYVVSHPPMALFQEERFVLSFKLGMPCYDHRDKPGLTAVEETGSVYILHASSDPVGKGTAIIVESIESLKRKGHKIVFQWLQGQPNSVVLRELDLCDFVVDQVYSDTPMGGFAAEAAMAGKPAVVGGYYADNIKKDIPLDLIPPSLFCRPEDLETAIERMITDKEYRIQLGAKAKLFIEQHWNSQIVTKNYHALVNGMVPEYWKFSPKDITEVHGYGLSEERIGQVVKAIVSSYGKKALQLSDKPELEKRLLELSEKN